MVIKIQNYRINFSQTMITKKLKKIFKFSLQFLFNSIKSNEKYFCKIYFIINRKKSPSYLDPDILRFIKFNFSNQSKLIYYLLMYLFKFLFSIFKGIELAKLFSIEKLHETYLSYDGKLQLKISEMSFIFGFQENSVT